MLHQYLYNCIEWLECQSVGIDTKAINQFRLDLEHKIGKRSKQNTRLLELRDLGILFPEHADLLYYKVEHKAIKLVYLDRLRAQLRLNRFTLPSGDALTRTSATITNLA